MNFPTKLSERGSEGRKRERGREGREEKESEGEREGKKKRARERGKGRKRERGREGRGEKESEGKEGRKSLDYEDPFRNDWNSNGVMYATFLGHDRPMFTLELLTSFP